MQRFETVKIILHGNAEFEAIDVTLQVKLARDQIRYSYNIFVILVYGSHSSSFAAFLIL